MSGQEKQEDLSDFELQLKELTNEMERLAKDASAQSASDSSRDKAGNADKLSESKLAEIISQFSTQNELLAGLSKTILDDSQKLTQAERLIEQLKKKNALETANQKLFDALHGELKSYKESALFEALQKPFIIDTLALRDDLQKILDQFQQLPEEHAKVIKNPVRNLSNVVDFVDEILARLSVEKIEEGGNVYDKQIHRVVDVVPADAEDQDGEIAKRLRVGYKWRNFVLRPVDVRIKKWQEVNE